MTYYYYYLSIHFFFLKIKKKVCIYITFIFWIQFCCYPFRFEPRERKKRLLFNFFLTLIIFCFKNLHWCMLLQEQHKNDAVLSTPYQRTCFGIRKRQERGNPKSWTTVLILLSLSLSSDFAILEKQSCLPSLLLLIVKYVCEVWDGKELLLMCLSDQRKFNLCKLLVTFLRSNKFWPWFLCPFPLWLAYSCMELFLLLGDFYTQR